MCLFVSYKSEDSNLVRAVVERLMVHGVPLWFDNYEILPETHGQFQELIDEGISHATHALAFTNANWSKSRHCRKEMKGLLERIPVLESIVEVCIPKESGPHEKFPALERANRILFTGNAANPSEDEIDSVVAGVAERLGLAEPGPSTPVVRGEHVSFERYGVELDPGPLRLSQHLSFMSQLINIHALRSATFMGTVEGIELTLEFHVWPFHTVLRDIAIPQDDQSDEEAVSDAYRDHARDWMRSENEHRAEPLVAKGLHLVFIAGTSGSARSNMGFTYTSVSKRVPVQEAAVWERRYAIPLRAVGTEVEGEAGLVFAARLEGSPQQQLVQFCRMAPQMEAIARSFRLRPQTAVEKVWSSAGLVAGRGAYAAAALVALFMLLARGAGLPVVTVVAYAAGYFVADLGSVVLRPLYRQVLWTLYPLADDLAQSRYERVSSDLFTEFTTIPFQLLGNIVFELRRAVGSIRRAATLALILAGGAGLWYLFVRPGNLPLTAVLLPGAAVLGVLTSLSSIEEWITKKKNVGKG